MITTDNVAYNYGYHWDGMIPISKSTALRYRSKGYQVYLLYSDNTESVACSVNDIISHAQKGDIFGIEKCTVA